MTEINVSETEEVLDFEYRLTNNGGGAIALEIGDRFEAAPVFGSGDAAIVNQVGVDVVRKGLMLMGLSDEESKSLTLLAISTAGYDDVDEGDDLDD